MARVDSIKGYELLDYEIFEDDRGSFSRLLPATFQSEGSNPFLLFQFNRSVNLKKGTIRGLHYQGHPFLDHKLITCTKGLLFDVAVDLRSESETFGHWSSFLVSPNSSVLSVARGLAHGYQTLEDNTELYYIHSAKYKESLDLGLNVYDRKLCIDWPLKTTTISSRDVSLPSFETFIADNDYL